jgi:bifunctional non-homologous end joining protein LigD
MARPAGSRRRGAVEKALAPYRQKRHFDRTPEPSGARARPGARSKQPRFVVQKHAASRLHYDFRLEHAGVLWSWSVPKGPSLSPSDRRLAVRTEDHPLEYADFEGIIPKGEYGGGTVLVWDRGTWSPIEDPEAGMRKGSLVFELDGEKLRGRWHLVRLRGREEKRENWLLFKSRDESAADESDVLREHPESALSGRTLEEVAQAADRTWHSNRTVEENVRAGATRRRKGSAARSGKAGRATRVAKAGRAPARERRGVDELVRALPVDFELTHLDKLLYPEQGIRKAELLAYYAVVAEWMLPHVANRPLTLVRCPDGRHRQCFFQKHARPGVPAAVGRIEIEEEGGKRETYMRVDDLPGLVALGQLGVLEVHTWVCHADAVERPDQLVFDVDPDTSLAWERVVEAALDVRRRMRALGLESFTKTTGGKGLHVVAPVTRRLSWDDHKGFARALAERMATEHPELYTANARKAERKGRIFLDALRNGRGATAVAAYSPRAREGAPVATPVTWKELEAGIRPRDFTVFTIPQRLSQLHADPWAGYANLRQAITAAARRALG